MSKLSKIIYFFISIVFFTAFDLYLSEQILNELRFKLPENNLFDLIFVQNTGAAFSIFENSKIFLIAFSVIALILILIYVIKNITKYSAFAAFWTAMLVSGISCNLYERIAFGYVRDFIKLNFVEFPVFNISDIFINLSVFALVIIIIKNNYLKK
ncbi:MAG: signal peptidase II [Bacteroides sp.]|nr:signal peptidase II [Bacteroides sp.]